MIKVTNLKKQLPEFCIDLNFTIQKSCIFGIVGRSGSGKTTTLKMLQGLLKYDSGNIQLNGSSNLIFQDFNLLNNLNVFDNVNLALKLKGIKEKDTVVEILSFVGLKDFINKFPSQLSGGQKQRVCIARALVTRPDIIFCDEPTASLDTKTSFEIIRLFKKIREEYKTTIVIVSHDLDVIKYLCDKVMIMKDGKGLIKDGL
ncbi:ATP-binding cassette domain-containing protein [Sneathia sp. DSM 16630]|uniref:ABC transporter ATP-binding protein n=1 Tax=uncultured Sneathia sp. TaxID=278067 RepID=UPI002594062B|nr:ATP-binding cassette domain-containing protein [uncultured Sneathia sp.]MBE2989707.1 ATP-binding cassette domain-containing protein [Sneathia sp. DSM 16630]